MERQFKLFVAKQMIPRHNDEGLTIKTQQFNQFYLGVLLDAIVIRFCSLRLQNELRKRCVQIALHTASHRLSNGKSISILNDAINASASHLRLSPNAWIVSRISGRVACFNEGGVPPMELVLTIEIWSLDSIGTVEIQTTSFVEVPSSE